MTTPATSRATAGLLEEAVAHIGRSRELTDVEALARWVADTVVQPDSVTGYELLAALAAADRESRRTGEGVVLAQAATGHVMVVRHFPDGQPTPIHGHGGWGAVVVLSGRGRYETWEPAGGGLARLVEAQELGAGDTLGWPEPPHDVHRQQGLTGGATELTIFARHPFFTWAPHFRPIGDYRTPRLGVTA